MWFRGVILKKRIPLLASPRGGVAASPRKWREASLTTPPGWCSLSVRSEHHPVLAKSDAAQYFLDRSATPPRGDARRGIRLVENGANFSNASERTCNRPTHVSRRDASV